MDTARKVQRANYNDSGTVMLTVLVKGEDEGKKKRRVSEPADLNKHQTMVEKERLSTTTMNAQRSW